jgi:prevent-host-death family protein
MLYTVSAREIQRRYKKVLKDANRIGEPVIVMANNKPLGAVIGLDLLEKIRLEQVVKQALDEYKRGKTRSISTKKELEDYFRELEEEVNIK